ncbi:hypothetical protein TWF718_010578 [Orbilia javanica]|uniref:Uncharacterized protein n=1 Tax=Orbilia javanica TaxID=47235 RepID=A0AAN8MSQ2_9PEZI
MFYRFKHMHTGVAKMLLVASQLLQHCQAIPLGQETAKRELSTPATPFFTENNTTLVIPEIKAVNSTLPSAKSDSPPEKTLNLTGAGSDRGSLRPRAPYRADMWVQCAPMESIMRITPDLYRRLDPNGSPARTYPNWANRRMALGMGSLRNFLTLEIERCTECECKIGVKDRYRSKLWELAPRGTSECWEERIALWCELVYRCYCVETALYRDDSSSGVILKKLGENAYLKGTRFDYLKQEARSLAKLVRHSLGMGGSSYRQLAPDTAEPYILEGPATESSINPLKYDYGDYTLKHGYDDYLMPGSPSDLLDRNALARWSRKSGYLKRNVETQSEDENPEPAR